MFHQVHSRRSLCSAAAHQAPLPGHRLHASLRARQVTCAYTQRDDGSDADQPSTSFTPEAADMPVISFKERYVRRYYLPTSFVLGSAFLGLRNATENFVLTEDPASFIGCVVVSGLLTMALAWVLFDFFDDTPGSNYSSPR